MTNCDHNIKVSAFDDGNNDKVCGLVQLNNNNYNNKISDDNIYILIKTYFKNVHVNLRARRL